MPSDAARMLHDELCEMESQAYPWLLQTVVNLAALWFVQHGINSVQDPPLRSSVALCMALLLHTVPPTNAPQRPWAWWRRHSIHERLALLHGFSAVAVLGTTYSGAVARVLVLVTVMALRHAYALFTGTLRGSHRRRWWLHYMLLSLVGYGNLLLLFWWSRCVPATGRRPWPAWVLSAGAPLLGHCARWLFAWAMADRKAHTRSVRMFLSTTVDLPAHVLIYMQDDRNVAWSLMITRICVDVLAATWVAPQSRAFARANMPWVSLLAVATVLVVWPPEESRVHATLRVMFMMERLFLAFLYTACVLAGPLALHNASLALRRHMPRLEWTRRTGGALYTPLEQLDLMNSEREELHTRLLHADRTRTDVTPVLQRLSAHALRVARVQQAQDAGQEPDLQQGPRNRRRRAAPHEEWDTQRTMREATHYSVRSVLRGASQIDSVCFAITAVLLSTGSCVAAQP